MSTSSADSTEIPCDVKARRWMRRCYLLRQEQAARRFWPDFFALVESGVDFEVRASFDEHMAELDFEIRAESSAISEAKP